MENSDPVCLQPFATTKIVGADGKVKLCCGTFVLGDYKEYGDISEKGSFLKAWNSEKAQRFRESILDGSFRYCNKRVCAHYGRDGADLNWSAYTYYKRFEDVPDSDVKRWIAEGRTEIPAPQEITLSHDLSCNLSCPQCRKNLIISSPSEKKQAMEIQRILFEEVDNPNVVHVAGQGDCAYSKVYRELLRSAHWKDTDARLILRTNGLLFDEEYWDEIEPSHANVSKILISIDAASQETYQVVRGGDFSVLDKNMRFISKISREHAIGVGVLFCVQKRNYLEMGAMVDLCREWGAWIWVRFSSIFAAGALGPVIEQHAVHMREHPLHEDFLQALRDPRLDGAVVHFTGPLLKLRNNLS